MKKYEYSYQKHDFNILKNEQGQLMLLLPAFEKSTSEHQLVYDGGPIATLDHLITLSLYGAPLDMHQDLIQTKEILVYETDKENIIREYTAKIKSSKKNKLS